MQSYGVSRKLIIISIVVLGIFFVGLYFYQAITLRVVSSNPSNLSIPTSQDQISFTFNQAIDTQPSIIVKEGRPYSYIVSGKTLTIRFSSPLASGDTLTLTVSVVSNLSSLTFTRSYTAAYVDFSDLSLEQQQQQIKESDSFETSYPLVGVLPVIANEYEIDYQFPSSKTNTMPIIITTTIVNASNPLAAADSPENLSTLRESRDAAMKFLNKNGYTSDKYSLYFTEPYLLSEYNGKSISELSTQ